MNGERDMLVLADPAVGEELQARLGAERVTHHVNPYDALVEMSRGTWGSVVVSAPRPDLPGLCRAVRRLQKNAKLLAVCPPPAEPEVRPLLNGLLDDYLIHPFTPSDLATLRAASGKPAPAPTPAPAERAAESGLSGQKLAALIQSARSLISLEACLVEIVSAEIGSPVRWADAGKTPGNVQPLLLLSEAAPRVLIPEKPPGPLSESAQGALATLQQCLPALVATARRTGSLHRLAITDHLTGAYNRRYFYHLTDQVLLRARQRGFRVTLLLYDIDDFKRYNDTYGHAAGDEILRETAQLMGQITRAHDIVARIGGDEFCVLFWDAEKPRAPGSVPPDSAYALADRFRRAVNTHEFPSLGPEARGSLTISGGLASFPGEGQTCRELLRKADQALRAAKEAGKNAIRLIGQD